MTDVLVREALRKAAIAWVSVDGRRGQAVWCLPDEQGIWLVTGPGEQDCPGLGPTDPPPAGAVTVTLRGDHGGRIVTWPAVATRLTPDQPDWDARVGALAGKRLNLPDDPATTAARWAVDCAVWHLTVAGPAIEAGATLPRGSLAAPPR